MISRVRSHIRNLRCKGIALLLVLGLLNMVDKARQHHLYRITRIVKNRKQINVENVEKETQTKDKEQISLKCYASRQVQIYNNIFHMNINKQTAVKKGIEQHIHFNNT